MLMVKLVKNCLLYLHAWQYSYIQSWLGTLSIDICGARCTQNECEQIAHQNNITYIMRSALATQRHDTCMVLIGRDYFGLCPSSVKE